MKNYEYVFDVRANVIKKVYYDEEKNYMVESLAPCIVVEELEKLQKENADLEEKLAEKEKNFEWLHQKLAKYVEHNQDKISFCIEQLKLLKENIVKYINTIYDDTTVIDEEDLDCILDNQINQLKEGK